MNKKQREEMNAKIKKHGEELQKFFGLKGDPVRLCKQLYSLERKAHHATTCLCNTNTLNMLELNRWTGYDVKQATEEEQDAFFDGIRRRLVAIIGKGNAERCFINHDPRGYALKIKDLPLVQRFYYTDWGSYGILAPDFTPQSDGSRLDRRGE